MKQQQGKSWNISGEASVTPGYMFGSWYLSLKIQLQGIPLSYEERHRYMDWFRQTFSLSEQEYNIFAHRRDQSDWACSVDLFLSSVFMIQSIARVPVFEKGNYLQEKDGTAGLFIPAHRGSGPAVIRVCQWLTACFELTGKHLPLARAERDADDIVATLRRSAPASTNIWGFIKAGYDMRMPFRQLPGKTYFFGQGCNGRWLDSSYTDRTSVIATQQVRYKPVATEIMKIYGLPVAEGHVVTNREQALRAAALLGYPVVVKPADQDRGDGVAADLRSEEELIRAFDSALKFSATILVEKHFTGRDYRLTVLEGKVIWAIERQPAAVTGDGVSTVRELIIRKNNNPLRGSDRRSVLKKIDFDAEAEDMLTRVALTAESVPDNGRFIPLRRSSNVSKGGLPVSVFDAVHQDNIQLAEKAARILKLDFAGVDLLIPDIAISWRESGAVICEVNAQPSIGMHTASHLYQPILRKLVGDNGRIPVFVLIGHDAGKAVEKLEADLLEQGVCCGVYDGQTVRVGGEKEYLTEMTCFQVGRFLVMDERTEAVVLAITDDSVQHSGLPFPCYDCLIVNGDYPSAVTTGLLDIILPACDGQVVLNDWADETANLIRSKTCQRVIGPEAFDLRKQIVRS
ncbi:MAG: acetate--CoA ligase family protein [Pseudomonadota bacterium]|nr:acetate--CoA ligase family protein [Pseudomonadota bacterium]